jgi:hypothetical protein
LSAGGLYVSAFRGTGPARPRFGGGTRCSSDRVRAAFFNDIGHILYTVEPYQNVMGCQVASPSPNGAVVDSTASVLSHEVFETITDPDFDGWWSDHSLTEWGAEIGDICAPVTNFYGQFLDSTFIVGGKNYKLQLEYSNKFHGCTH